MPTWDYKFRVLTLPAGGWIIVLAPASRGEMERRASVDGPPVWAPSMTRELKACRYIAQRFVEGRQTRVIPLMGPRGGPSVFCEGRRLAPGAVELPTSPFWNHGPVRP